MRKTFLIGGMVLAVAFIFITIVTMGGQSSTSASIMTPIPTASTAISSAEKSSVRQRPRGGKAITGPVTEDTIRAYFTDHEAVPGVVVNNLRIINIRFTTVGQLPANIKGSLLHDFPASEPVAYVTIGGDFHVDGSPVRHTGFDVFSATTGNLLLAGTK